MRECVIVTAKRTAIGKKGGIFASVEPEELVAPLIEQVVQDCQLASHEIDDVILGNVVGPGGNIARVALLEAGLPISVPGFTVDRQCGAGLEAIQLAARLVQSGAGDIYLAGGVESTSRAPWRLARPKHITGDPILYERAPFTPEAFGNPDMGEAAEHVAQYYQISREKQDHFAVNSHRKAVQSQHTDHFAEEIIPICTQGEWRHKDECPRDRQNLEKLFNRMPPVFKENGSVTAANACPVNDGAAISLVMSREKCDALGLTPALRFVDAQAAGVEPEFLGIGPVPAVQKVLARQQMDISSIDIVEFNEAFASQTLACLETLGISEKKVNLGGGALALGHPYGASGAVLVTRLVSEMQNGTFHYGLATLGIGGGMGLAMLVERI
ncbi:MAG TPA: thiolase family protein [Pseudogracilibacillus sp.]|nr:thiolase family protein [Pseudogracilibacillus sp.]